MAHPLSGVYAAAVTPLNQDLSPDADGLLSLLDFLAGRGCHGALLLGTTGEGPSFSLAERRVILEAALAFRKTNPGFRLLAGVGMPSQDDTLQLTKQVFDWGYDGVVVLPPYYYRSASDDGLFAWFSAILEKAVPSDGAFLGYHIPGTSGVPLSLDLLARLKDAFPTRFLGIKDSSASLDHALALGERFGSDLFVLNGTDRLLAQALTAGAAGCITAMANLVSPDLRLVWEKHQQGETDLAAEARLSDARGVSDRFPPAAPLIKMLLHEFHGLPSWPVKPPLLPMPAETALRAAQAWKGRGRIA